MVAYSSVSCLCLCCYSVPPAAFSLPPFHPPLFSLYLCVRLDDVVVRPDEVGAAVAVAPAALVELDGDAVAEPGDGAHGVALNLAHKVHLPTVERGACKRE